VTFEFDVSLKGENQYVDHQKTGRNVDKVIKWYKDNANLSDAKDFEVKHVNGDRFEITCTIPSDELRSNKEEDVVFFIEMMVDPDDDGNHPIKIGRYNYLVVGKLVTVNGKEYYPA